MNKIFVIFGFLIFVALLQSCDSASEGTVVAAIQHEGFTVPANYGNGVYYFNCVGKNFGVSLSYFLGQDTLMEVKAITGNGTAPYGADLGYFVVMGKK